MKAKMNPDQQATNRIFDEIDLIKDIDFIYMDVQGGAKK